MIRFEALFKGMTKPWVIVSYAAMMVCLFLYVDKSIAIFFDTLEHGHFQTLLGHITILGKSKPTIGILVILALIFRYVLRLSQWEAKAWFLCLCTLIPSVIVLALKILFGRARPELLFSDGLYGFQWLEYSRPFWSFPSGHTATIMGLVFGLCIVWPKQCLIFLSLGCLVMLSRIVLVQHYMSDVMVSAYLALIEVGVLQWVFQRYAPEFMKEVRE